MCFALIAAWALPAEPALLGCSPAAPTLCRYLQLLFKTSADGELAGKAGIATRGSGARRGEGGSASPGGVGVPSPGLGGEQEGRAEHGSVLAPLAFTGMGILKTGSWAAALARCAVAYVTDGRNQRSRNS